eukprot:312203-Prorocentrum_minimum.AAC.1
MDQTAGESHKAHYNIRAAELRTTHTSPRSWIEIRATPPFEPKWFAALSLDAFSIRNVAAAAP